jgi:rhamnosyltransferase
MKQFISKSDICSVIITFNPDNNLIELIERLSSSGIYIIIIDNNSKVIEEDKITSFKNLHYLKNEINYGIAKALNQGVDIAHSMGYQCVLTFDQDTGILPEFSDILIEALNQVPFQDKVGAISLNSIDNNNQVYYEPNALDNDLYYYRDYLITSGCLICVDSFYNAGKFDEDLFIDNVDLDFSLRLRTIGKSLLITKKIGMIHKPGNSLSKKCLWFNIESSNHNANRRYFMAKNNIVLTKKYIFRYPYFILKMNFFFVIAIFKMLIVELDLLEKIVSISKGVKDGVMFKTNFHEV